MISDEDPLRALRLVHHRDLDAVQLGLDQLLQFALVLRQQLVVFQFGRILGRRRWAQVSANAFPARGQHLLADLDGIDAARLCDPVAIESLLRQAAAHAGATVLQGHFHHFGPQQGVTGVLLLAESHLSIHTWPEARFAALDIFLCGALQVEQALEIIVAGLQPEQLHRQLIERQVRLLPMATCA
jgi:S-adenosylmethionine decarboxylase